MISLAKITVVGYIGNDAELNQINGQKVCNFSVSYNGSKYNKATQTYDPKTTWFQISFWKKPEIYEQLKKGAQVLIDGKFDVDEYTTKDNQKSFSLKIVAEDVLILQKKNDG